MPNHDPCAGPAKPPARRSTTLTLAYDGDCGFCQTVLDRLATARPAIAAVPWQSLPPSTVSTHLERFQDEVLLLDGDTAVAGGAPALAAYLHSSPLTGYRLLARLVSAPPVRPAAAAVYRWVARHRHSLPGGTPACAVRRPPAAASPGPDS
ncbi:thiol-disulfide oxidoreductase DCC family protein [Kitasatospora sp. NPDC089913]|uniref:thiol-disulfide oxidoreductase DCC family protein n=1 Tax=Kitasatospora sp. NPDC089913 TaxID=3364080 RepID=UPI00380F2B3F